jgi:hypothetical protein
VVQSLVRQIRHAGGRFLQNCTAADGQRRDVWIEVSDKVMRDKVSHALRDKHPRSNIEYAKAIMLSVHRRTGDGQWVCRDDHFVAAANERLLRVELPERACTSAINVECILTHELESLALLSARDRVLAEECFSFFPIRPFIYSSTAGLTEGLAGPYRQDDSCPPNFIMNHQLNEELYGGIVGIHCCDDCFLTRPLASKEEILDLENASAVSTQNPNCTKHQNLIGREVELHYVIDIGDDNSVDRQDSVEHWTKNAVDLPPTFTAEDCEDLLATLDFASSFA